MRVSAVRGEREVNLPTTTQKRRRAGEGGLGNPIIGEGDFCRPRASVSQQRACSDHLEGRFGRLAFDLAALFFARRVAGV